RYCNLHSHAQDCAGSDLRLDSQHAVITNKDSALLQSRIPKVMGCIRINLYLAPIVLQIGICCACSQVTTFTQHGTAQIAIMPFVAVAADDGIVELATPRRMICLAHISIEYCSCLYTRIITNHTSIMEHTPRLNHRIICYVYRTVESIQISSIGYSGR